MDIKTPVIAFSMAAAAALPAMAQTPGQDASGCGWYVVLGCSKAESDARRTFNQMGGPGMGGGAGAQVLDTSRVGGFRAGFYCVTDGPYVSQIDAQSVPWVEAVPDAYVKRGCR